VNRKEGKLIMRANPFSIRAFLKDTSGAIAVDYVVLTAGATGMAVMISEQLTAGYAGFSGAVAAELNHRGNTTPVEESVLLSHDFDNGLSGGWYGSGVVDVPGIGSALGPIGKDTTSAGYLFDIPASVELARLDFDVYALDGIEPDETGSIYIDNVKIGEILGGREFRAANHGVEGLWVEATVVARDVDLGGWRNASAGDSEDTKISFTVKKRNPGAQMRFEFEAHLSAGRGNESFVLDNVALTGLSAGGSGAIGASEQFGPKNQKNLDSRLPA
jgi:hypothetical protein